MAIILVVEDELAQLFKQSLAVAGERYMVETATDGYEAIRKAKALKPDLIIMDLHMPRMDGLETIQRIRRFDRDVPILAITAFPANYSRDKAIKAGATAFMLKPFDIPELLEKMGKMLPRTVNGSPGMTQDG